MRRMRKNQRPQTWEEAQPTVDPVPFADLFGEYSDDIFDVSPTPCSAIPRACISSRPSVKR